MQVPCSVTIDLLLIVGFKSGTKALLLPQTMASAMLVNLSVLNCHRLSVLLFPVLVLASSSIFMSRTVPTATYHTPFCYSRTSHHPGQRPNPDHCDEAVLRFRNSIPSSYMDPTFTKDPDKAKLPNIYLVPRQVIYRDCTVTVNLYRSGEAVIDMAFFVYQGDMVIEDCLIKGVFNGGDIVMEGELPGQAIEVSIGFSGPHTGRQSPEVALESSALIRRTSQKTPEYFCYPRTSSSPKEPIGTDHCMNAFNRLWTSIQPPRNHLAFTNNASKAASLPNYILLPQHQLVGSCLTTISMPPRIKSAEVRFNDFLTEGYNIVFCCLEVGRPGAYSGGETLIAGEHPMQAILLSFTNMNPSRLGLGTGDGNVTDAFMLPVS